MRFARLAAVWMVAAMGIAGCATSAPPPHTELLPRGGYAVFAHFGTNPVVDAEDEAEVRIGLAGDRASWRLVRHYLDRGILPPAEAVRVEDCVAALAPPLETAVETSRAGASLAVVTSLAPSPFRPGWQVLVVTIATPVVTSATIGGASDVVVVSDTPEGALERALVGRGARLYAGDLTRLGAALDAAERVVVASDGAGLGGVDAQAELLDTVARAREHGTRVSVAGRIAPGLDDALLDRLALLGGGLYELQTVGAEAALAERLARQPGLSGGIATLRFDATRVSRWRLVGHESRAGRPRGEHPIGGVVPSGETIDLVFELKLAEDVAAWQPLGRVRIGGDDNALDVVITPGEATPRDRAVMVIAALAEKLRGSYWMKDLSWEALAGEATKVAPTALQAELSLVIGKARALWVSSASAESPLTSERGLP